MADPRSRPASVDPPIGRTRSASAAAAGATSGATSGGAVVNPTVLTDAQLQLIAAAVSAAVSAQPPPSVQVNGPVDSPARKEHFKLPVFHGNPGDSRTVDTFLVKVGAYFNTLSIVSDSVQVSALFACFPHNSPAGVWFAHQYPSFTTYAQFEAAFRTQFQLTGADKNSLLAKLDRFRQRDSDSVASYYAGLTVLFTNLSAINEPVPAGIQTHKFVNGLVPALREKVSPHLVTNASLTLIDAFTLATQYESLRPPTKLRVLSARERQVAIRQKNFCHFCKKTGHVWDSCPRIQKLKAEGKWRDKPQPTGQQN